MLDVIPYLMCYPTDPGDFFTFILVPEVLKAMNEAGMIINHRKTGKDIIESIEHMRNTEISISLKRISAAGTEVLYETKGPVLPIEKNEEIYFYTENDYPPLYAYGVFLENLYGKKKPETDKAHTSFINIVLLHYLLRRIESVPKYPFVQRRRTDSETGESVSVFSSTTPRIRFESMLDALNTLISEEDRTNPRIRRELFEKELRILKHLQSHGYLETWHLTDSEYTEEFSRYTIGGSETQN